MKKTWSTGGLFLAVSLLVSCSALQSSDIVGERKTFSEEEVGSESVWKIEDQLYYVRVASANRLVASTVKWDKDRQAHKLETEEIVLSRLGDDQFLNLKIEDLYHIHYMVPSDDGRVLLFYGINPDALNKHLGRGVVKRDARQDVYTLEGTKEEVDQFIRAHIKSIYDPRKVTAAHLISGSL